MLSLIERPSTSPCSFRSSGHSAIPWSIASFGDLKCTGLPFHLDLARDDRVRSEDRPHDFRPSRADQSGKAQNLALAKLEAYVPYVVCLQIVDLQQNIAHLVVPL